MSRLILITFAFASIIFTQPAHALFRHSCSEHTFEGQLLKYCIDYGSPNNHDILYIFTGSNGTEQDWVKAIDNVRIQQVWDTEGIRSPTKITISFGDEWDFNDADTPANPSLQRLFVTQIIPYIESQIPGPHGRRLFKGVSMGGWNGVQLLLKNSELFDKMALICPVISMVTPFSPQADIDAFIAKNQPYINLEWFNDLLEDERKMFATVADWNRHDPLVLVHTAQFKTKSIYLSCAKEDQYGFFEGSALFAKLAQGHGAPVTWQPTTGGHCVIDEKVVAHFFTDLN